MKLVTFINKNTEEKLGLFLDGAVFDIEKTAKEFEIDLPSDMNTFLNGGDVNLNKANQLQIFLLETDNGNFMESSYRMIAPVPHPTSCRDAYAFRQHVEAARRNRGVEMIPEFDQFPIFYFTNHNAVEGEGDIIVEKDHLQKLDFELEIAAVIGKKGRNISASEADDFIAGYTIMNDMSARLLQMEEMKLNLGPAKGKDFSTVIGPWLVTKDELEPYKIESESGDKYDLRMTAKHNGDLISDGNVKDMTWTFAEIIERCSYGADILPGDVIGSGTVGTGCYLELNGTRTRLAKEKGEVYEPVWLQDGDTMELEITGLGILKNKIVYSGNGLSILEKKKNI